MQFSIQSTVKNVVFFIYLFVPGSRYTVRIG